MSSLVETNFLGYISKVNTFKWLGLITKTTFWGFKKLDFSVLLLKFDIYKNE